MYRTTYFLSLVLLAPVLAACSNDDPTDPMMMADASTGPGDGTSTDPAASTGGGSSATDATGAVDSSGGVDVGALYDCEDPDIMASPLSGPGFDPETGEFIGSTQETYLAHTTQILVRPEALADFQELTDAIGAQLMQTPGIVGVGFAREPNCGFLRTMGVWESEQAMFAFAGSGAHAEAMTRATEISITGRTVHWELSGADMPLTWEMAMAAIDGVEPLAIYD